MSAQDYAGRTRYTRAERLAQITALIERGLTHRQIAGELGLSPSGVREIIYDPDGSKQRERRKRYEGTCIDCGARTDGANGREKAPIRCDACNRVFRQPEHGTRSRYTGGCRCTECRAANAAKARAMKGKEPPQHGTRSAYANFGCRCDDCRRAHREFERTPKNRRYQQKWMERIRGTEPREHGTPTAYDSYACRCDICRAGNAARHRAWRARRKEVSS